MWYCLVVVDEVAYGVLILKYDHGERMLKPQDVMIILKIVAMHQRDWKYSEAALELSMSPSEVHAGVKRLKRCSLLTELRMNIGSREQRLHLPDISSLKEFLRYGLRHVFPAQLTEPARGLPTSTGVEHLFVGLTERNFYKPVWELQAGEYEGIGLKPLYPSAPQAAVNDFTLYELLALTDAIRGDNQAVREFAWTKINLMLGDENG